MCFIYVAWDDLRLIHLIGLNRADSSSGGGPGLVWQIFSTFDFHSRCGKLLSINILH